MLLRFIGDYTNGRKSMTICNVTFHGREPSEVTDPESIRRLSNHREFELVTVSQEPAPEVPAQEPKRRGRPRKAV